MNYLCKLVNGGKKAGITKMLTSVIPKPNKTKISTKLGVSRSSLYYQSSKDQLDEQEKLIIIEVMRDNPAYGHKRIAMHLHWGKNHVKRLMKKFNLKPARRRIQRAPKKPEDYHQQPASYYNFYKMYKELNQIDERGIFWRADFTYIKVKGKFYYQATVLEVATREIVGYSLADHHDASLVIEALEDALSKNKAPLIFHSDQGSEYRSEKQIKLCEENKIIVSMSDKAKPGHNAHQESFFSHFKLEFGDFERFDTLGELFAEISQMIYYYNYKRIHTALKMSPVAYREVLINREKRQIV